MKGEHELLSVLYEAAISQALTTVCWSTAQNVEMSNVDLYTVNAVDSQLNFGTPTV